MPQLQLQVDQQGADVALLLDECQRCINQQNYARLSQMLTTHPSIASQPVHEGRAQTLMYYAIQQGFVSAIELLVQCGVGPDGRFA